MKKLWQFLGLTQENALFVWNHTKNQFRVFFSNSYATPLTIICFGVVLWAAMSAVFAASSLQQNIDAKLAQRKEELNKLFDEKDQGYEVARKISAAKNEECWNDFKNNRARYDVDSLSSTDKYLTRLEICGSVQHPYVISRNDWSYMGDDYYKELTRIKNTSSFQLFIDNLGFGWLGVIALAGVFLINILIALVKLPVLPHNNLRQAKWLSMPFCVLLMLWMFQSVWFAFAVGIMLAGIFDWHSIKTAGLNRIVSILIVYSVAFFLLLLVATKIQAEGWLWQIEFLDGYTHASLWDVMRY